MTDVALYHKACRRQDDTLDALGRVAQLLRTHPDVDVFERADLTRALASIDRRNL